MPDDRPQLPDHVLAAARAAAGGDVDQRAEAFAEDSAAASTSPTARSSG